ncbi:MAG: DNA polymerase III [Salinisphaeraceae bacterium]|jgi:inhibitor of KinA sporulation pathway (predicted exonuclease)|nr:DNA polymerase III [Salinisphaeraceae bacterium]
MRPILIVDFEATCWGPDTLPPSVPAGRAYASEIIEFGCALMTRPDRVERTWQTHVRPTDNPLLSDFCTELTGIRQDQADAAPYFIDALELFRDEFGIRGGAQPRFASWGNYDRNALLDECAYRNVEYPFRDDNHVNLKAEAVKALGLKRRMGLSRTLEAIGLAFEGRPHAGVDDAWNIGRVVMEMFRRGWKPPVKRPGS